VVQPGNQRVPFKKKDALELLMQSLEAFKIKSGFYPEQIFIHAKLILTMRSGKDFRLPRQTKQQWSALK